MVGVNLVVRLWLPTTSVEVTTVKLPLVAVPSPSEVVPSNISIVPAAAAGDTVPVMVTAVPVNAEPEGEMATVEVLTDGTSVRVSA